MTRPLRSARTSHLAARFRPTVDRLEGRALMAFAGSLDPTFGVGGFSTTQLHSGTTSGLSSITAAATETDGSIVELGPAGTQADSSLPTTYGLIHLTASGAPDTSFGVGGEADLTLPAGQTASGPGSLLVQPNGKIVIAGTAAGALPNSASIGTVDTIAARFNANGTPDTSFGTNGLVEIPASGVAPAFVEYSALEANGQILLAAPSPSPGSSNAALAPTVTRLDANGQLDTAFGTGGTQALTGLNYLNGLVAEPGGQILAYGGLYSANISGGIPNPTEVPVIDRLDADGTLDPSFSEAGVQSTKVGDVGSLVVQPNGQIVAIGAPFDSGGAPTIVSRLNADGSLAQSVTLPNHPSAQFQYAPTLTGPAALSIDPHGDILIIVENSLVVGPAVARLTPNLTLDDTFGTAGIATIPAPLPATTPGQTEDLYNSADSLAITPSGQVIVAGTGENGQIRPGTPYFNLLSAYDVVARLNPTGTSARQGDFTGDGISDPAVFLAGTATFVIGNSSGGAGQAVQLGIPGVGNTIPAPGDYFGIGRDAPAVYIARTGYWAITDPTGATAGLLFPFGQPGVGNTIPAPGDYYGTGADQVAVYLAQAGDWDILAPGLKPGLSFHFGQPGVGLTIPVPGDYAGTGADQVAVYLPLTGTWSILGPGLSGVTDVQFGIPGLGNTIPAPGDYDGSGHTELGVYLPGLGEFQFISGAGQVVTVPFGVKGAGQTLPAPGDYDGSGLTELAAYLPGQNRFAFRPAGGGGDLSFTVGFTDQGPIVPVTPVVPAALLGSGSVSADAIGAPGVMGEADDLDFLMPLASDAKKKAAEASAN